MPSETKQNIYVKTGQEMHARFVQLAIDPRFETEHYAFTFGHGQEHFNHYVVIPGTYDSAREEMVRRFGMKWSMQYPYNLAFAHIIVRWNWKELV